MVPLVVLMIAVVGGCRSSSDRADGVARGAPSPAPTATRHLVFPDGSSVDLTYPETADLDRLSFHPEASVHYSPYGESPDRYGQSPDRPDRASAHPCCSRGLTIKRGTVREVMGDRAPTSVYTGANGQDVLFFDSPMMGAGPAELPELAFQFGSWTVMAFDYAASDPRGARMTDEQRAVFASSLDGREDDQGFLLLEPHGSLCLQPPKGPDGELGDAPGTTAVMLYLHPRPHGAVKPASEKTARGYDVVHWSPYHSSLVLPDHQFELGLPGELRWLEDDVEIAHLHHEHRWRC